MNNNFCDPRLLVPLKEFCDKIKNDWSCGYYWGVFLPYVMEKYKESAVKIFFIGRDTREWMNESGFECLKDFYEKNKLQEYLTANSEFNPEDEVNNNTSSFWTFACKLYLSIMSGKNYYDVRVRDYSEEDFDILKGLGYGNMYAIEKRESLMRENGATNSWDDDIVRDGNEEQYWHMFNAAQEILNKYRYIAEFYSPKVSFCMCWEFEDWDRYFEGCDYDYLEEYSKNNYYCTYRINYQGKESYFIQTYHPTHFIGKKWKNEDREDYMLELVELYNKLISKK